MTRKTALHGGVLLCFLLLLLLLVPLLLFTDKVIGVIEDAREKTLPQSLSL